MVEGLYFLLGTMFGIVVTRLWWAAGMRWKRAKGMMQAPDKAKNEGRQKIAKAKEEAAKGRSEMVRALFYFAAAIAVALVAAWALLSL